MSNLAGTLRSRCPVESLPAYAEGRLDPPEAAAMEAHLAACEGCCELLGALPPDPFSALLRRACDPADFPTAAAPPALDATPAPGGVTLELESGARAPLPELPGYEVLRELGRGGMGVVYEAVHAVMGRRVAIKVIHPEFLRHPAALQRFRLEARAAARLSHPNLVIAFDAGQVGDGLFLAMELVEGEGLADLLRRGGPLPLTEACDYVRQAALGLQCAHERGLVHRDVKPHNLMRTSDGTIKVLDFGLAALGDDRLADGRRTASNAVMGTPDYMAPEQAEDARAADARADVYSLGCTLLHLLTGQVPFPAATVLQKLLAHRLQAPPSARRLRPEVPARLDAVLRRAMAKRPARRFRSAGELARALEPFADRARRPEAPAPAGRRPRRRLAAAVALALVLAGAAAAVVVATGRGREAGPPDDPPAAEANPAPAQPGDAEQVGEVRRFDGHTALVPKVAISPDGRLVYSASWDHTVRVWDRETGRELRKLAEGVGTAEVLDLSGDGRWLLTGGPGTALQVLDAASGEERVALRGHTLTPMCGALSPDGRRALTGGKDCTLRLWDLDTGQELRVLRGHTDSVRAAAFSPDGRLALSGGNDRTVRLWDLESGRELRQLPGTVEWVLSVAFSHDGRRALAPGGTGTAILVWEVESGREVGRFHGFTNTPVAAAFSPDDSRILAGGWDGTLHVWDASDGAVLACLPVGGQGVLCATFSDGGRCALVGCGDGTARLWRLPDGPPSLADGEVRRFPGRCGEGNAPVAFTADGGKVLAGDSGPFPGGLTRVWDRETGREQPPLLAPAAAVVALASVPGDRAFAADRNSFVALWDVAGARLLDCRHIQHEPITALAASPDGKQVLCGSPDGVIRLWDVGGHQRPRVFGVAYAPVRALAFAPDGSRLLSAGEDGIMRLWNFPDGQEVKQMPGHVGAVRAVAFAPDGHRALSAGVDGRVCLWEVDWGRQVKLLMGHERPVEAVAFTPDGRRALTAGQDRTVRLWDLETGRELRRFDGCSAPVAVAPDGRFALTAGDGQALRLWRLPEPPPADSADRK